MIRKTLSERGQVTIPKAMRDRFGMRPGTELEFEDGGDQILVRKVGDPGTISSVYGVLKGQGRTDDLIRELRGDGEQA